MNSNSFTLRVIDKDEVIFDGEVKAMSAKNRVGRFDVLPIHSNFISLLDEEVIIHMMDGTTKTIKCNDGVVRVLEGRAEVYLGIRSGVAQQSVPNGPAVI